MGSRRGYKKEEEDFLKKLVNSVIDQFFKEFSHQSSRLAPPDNQPPESEKEYSEYIWTFIEKNLSSFYQPGNPFVEDPVREAAARAKQLTAELDLEPKLTPKVVTLALYDFVIFCDDSGSMQTGNRVAVLEDTCQRVADIATFLQPQGISLRFINNDDKFDGSVDKNDIRKKVHGVQYTGMTQLGTMLQSKIIKPLIVDKIKARKYTKPLLAIIITDGCPTIEPEKCLQEVLKCKQILDQHHFSPASAVFLISRVGDDQTQKNS
ncbi:hypothetical protein PAAG_02284 [Paracoccidioides lutzii Pb01]|uniref:VWFA domain-containing protein n=1 Tax=Paracoccidioides lutzii (strain ATCC MYA-826 / Pb01) TaxID=502779 RepID=C1GVK7_PARBA|nr:hypothetical protein PAAG_02284 [Paracoccidioides lutzii Pb01]EEH40229.1 hypothetical protein PAAG_02284 [Paracoccidioides lutzii Pb01]